MILPQYDLYRLPSDNFAREEMIFRIFDIKSRIAHLFKGEEDALLLCVWLDATPRHANPK